MTAVMNQAASSTVALPVTTRRIVLTGFMGAGKSTVGRLLAARLGWALIDIDHQVERATGTTIQHIFDTQGEAAFRQLESVAIARAMAAQHAIIALGGGAPAVLTNRLLLEQTPGTTVVFLDAPFPVLFDRCVLQEGAAVRPVLLDPAAAAARFHQRAPHYRRSATHRIDTEDLQPAQTAEALLQLLSA